MDFHKAIDTLSAYPMSPRERRGLWAAIHAWRFAETVEAQQEAAREIEILIAYMISSVVDRVSESMATPKHQPTA